MFVLGIGKLELRGACVTSELGKFRRSKSSIYYCISLQHHGNFQHIHFERVLYASNQVAAIYMHEPNEQLPAPNLYDYDSDEVVVAESFSKAASRAPQNQASTQGLRGLWR